MEPGKTGKTLIKQSGTGPMRYREVIIALVVRNFTSLASFRGRRFANGMASPHFEQSATKYHFPGWTKLDIA
jgi:hypothetical protein